MLRLLKFVVVLALAVQITTLALLLFKNPPDVQVITRGLPKVGATAFKTQTNDPTIRLLYKGDFRCTAAVVDAAYAVTAAHCVVNGSGLGLESGMSVTDITSTHYGDVKVVGLVHRLDYALIYGDFSNFRKFRIKHKKLELNTMQSQLAIRNVAYPEEYQACGYPMGARTKNCVTFVPLASWGFQVIGTGQLFPGMSGGPVTDSSGALVGVNSAVYADKSIISPVVGIFSAFGVE
jgi:hypothetical protein